MLMQGREHFVGIKPLGRGLMLSILRYADELRPAEPYFEGINAEPRPQAVALAPELIERETGRSSLRRCQTSSPLLCMR
jgi:DNA end-binding protein Ku